MCIFVKSKESQKVKYFDEIYIFQNTPPPSLSFPFYFDPEHRTQVLNHKIEQKAKHTN